MDDAMDGHGHEAAPVREDDSQRGIMIEIVKFVENEWLGQRVGRVGYQGGHRTVARWLNRGVTPTSQVVVSVL